MDLEELDALGVEEAQSRLATLIEQAGWLPSSRAESFLAEHRATVEAHFSALRRYAPKPYPGSITLLRARDRDERAGDAREPDFDWSPLCAGSVDVRTVPGTHWTIVIPPHVDEVARVLDGVLASALLSSARPEADPL